MTDASGGCLCGEVRFALTGSPLIVHACHCRGCQRATGGAFVVNVWIEEDRVERHSGELASTRTSGPSGNPIEHFFCTRCGTFTWTRYHAAPAGTLFVRCYDRGERIHHAMLARGFTGTMPDLQGMTRTLPRGWAAALAFPATAIIVTITARLP